MIFDITVEELTSKATLPFIVSLTAGDKTIECHVRTKEKAMKYVEQFQKRGWTKVQPAHRFLQYLGGNT